MCDAFDTGAKAPGGSAKKLWRIVSVTFLLSRATKKKSDGYFVWKKNNAENTTENIFGI